MFPGLKRQFPCVDLTSRPGFELFEGGNGERKRERGKQEGLELEELLLLKAVRKAERVVGGLEGKERGGL